MKPLTLFLVIVASILTAAGAIYGIRQASLGYEHAKVVNRIHAERLSATDRRIKEIEDARDLVASAEDRRNALALAYQYRSEVYSELAYYLDSRGSEEEKVWREQLRKVERLGEEILSRPIVR